jgi:hypothetical protein
MLLLVRDSFLLFNTVPMILGSNPGCGTNGFPAEVGWDPVSATRDLVVDPMA